MLKLMFNLQRDSVEAWAHATRTNAASVVCATFSADSTHILCGCYDKRVAVWTAPKGILAVAAAVDASKELVSTVNLC
jgi:hypothetical protein